MTDPRGKTTSYVYNGFGQPTSQASPDTGTTSLVYGTTGLRTSMTRNDGSSLAYGHDVAGRPTSATGGGESRHFVYDSCAHGVGRLCTAESRVGGTMTSKVAYAYTLQGELASVVNTAGATADTTSYLYDAMGRVTKLTYPSGVSANYAYVNGALRTMTATLSTGGTINVATSIAHEPFGAVKGWTYGNGIVRGHNRDLNGRLTGISSVYGGTVHQSLTYAWNANDLIGAVTNGADPDFSHSYQYDALGRLTRDAYPGDSTVFVDGFDAVGNRTSRTRHDNGVPTSTLTYPIETTSNRMLAMNGSVNRNFVYNPNGHLASSTGWLGNRTYAYDAFDRLKSTTIDGTATSYLVNALDQRVGKSGPLGSFRYAYAGQNTLLGEHTGAGLTGWRNFLYLGGQPVAVISGNNVRYFLHNDHLGRPELMTDANRAAVWKAANGAYSRTVTLGDPTAIVLGFPGQQWDEETQTWYNGFRDYDPYTGRYIQSDPIGLQGGLNTYAYVRGNPINLVDPFGLAPGDCYPTQDVAAANAIGDVNHLSRKNGIEYGGRIYQNANGTFSYTAPNVGTARSVNIGPLMPNTVGDYHTHTRSENFSTHDGGDIDGIISSALKAADHGNLYYKGYLGTPSGVIKSYDPVTGETKNLPYPAPKNGDACSCK